MKAYSINLRKKIVHSVNKGISKSEIGRRFEISWSRRSNALSNGAARRLSCVKKETRLPFEAIDESALLLLEQDLESRPWATHRQKRKFLYGICGVEVSEATICRAIKRRLFHSRKKVQRQQANGTRG
jgi:transposase